MLSPDLILNAYAQGVFPMAESRDAADVFWVSPERRGLFPIGGFHISRSLARSLRSGRFSATFDRDFLGVVMGCADRAETWINPPILSVYRALHARGEAHSVEVWAEDRLVGGVFGIRIGAVFFGESMFSRETDASKVALAVLHDRLVQGGFRLFDTQFLTPHLASLGAVEVPRGVYLRQLAQAVQAQARFTTEPADLYGVAQRNGQTS